LVEERIVRTQQIQDAEIVMKLVLKEKVGFLLEVGAQILVEVREEIRIWCRSAKLPELQPLGKKVVHERVRARLGQHSAHLLLEHRGILQLRTGRENQKLVVGNAAPQEERKAGSQLLVADAIGRSSSDIRRIALDSEQEFGVDEHPFDRTLNAGVES